MKSVFSTTAPADSCLCAQVRKVARKLSSHYDRLLAPEDLTITQYSLLASIGRAGLLSHAALAEKVGMERTTLTRNLRPLTRSKWVAATTGKDRRQHLLRLTAVGERKLSRSLPHWQDAQRQIFSRLGLKSLQELRELLVSTESSLSELLAENQGPRERGNLSERGKVVRPSPRGARRGAKTRKSLAGQASGSSYLADREKKNR